MRPAARARIEPEPARTVFPGSPLVVFGKVPPRAGSVLIAAWKDGAQARQLEVPLRLEPGPMAEAVRLPRLRCTR